MATSLAAGRIEKPSLGLLWAGFLLGFGLGGFFDGILLHQVLQWHHLLSNVKSPFFNDLRIQLLADGLFHVLMYFIAFAGLWLLWRTRRQYAERGGDRILLAWALIGFGAWHMTDGVLSHWVLGIHRIRVNVANPLFWDILWFVLFGLIPLALGWHLSKHPDAGAGGSGKAAGLALGLLVMMAAPLSALPPPNSNTVLVFFKPAVLPQRIFQAMEATDARIVWAANTGDLWALDIRDKAKIPLLYKHGAYFASNSVWGFGCLAWSSLRRE